MYSEELKNYFEGKMYSEELKKYFERKAVPNTKIQYLIQLICFIFFYNADTGK